MRTVAASGRPVAGRPLARGRATANSLHCRHHRFISRSIRERCRAAALVEGISPPGCRSTWCWEDHTKVVEASLAAMCRIGARAVHEYTCRTGTVSGVLNMGGVGRKPTAMDSQGWKKGRELPAGRRHLSQAEGRWVGFGLLQCSSQEVVWGVAITDGCAVSCSPQAWSGWLG